MRQNVWTTSLRCESGACVEVQWRKPCEGASCVQVGFSRSSRCEGGDCVEVGFAPSSRCESGDCVEVGFASSSGCDSSTCVEVSVGAAVLVRDSKDLDVKPLTYTPTRWTTLLDRVRADEPIDWDAEFFPLVFDAEEITAFVGGVGNGEFDLKED